MSGVVENGLEDTPMFNPALMKGIDWESKKASFKNGISPSNPGESLVLRPLSSGDYDRGYVQLLGQLTRVGDLSRELFHEQFESMRSCANTYYVTVLEDTNSSQVIGTATLAVEQKFIHSAGCRGRIEDVVVSDQYRGRQLGKLLVQSMTLLGKSVGCYKISLECTTPNTKFYESFGFHQDGNNYMVQRFKD